MLKRKVPAQITVDIAVSFAIFFATIFLTIDAERFTISLPTFFVVPLNNVFVKFLFIFSQTDPPTFCSVPPPVPNVSRPPIDPETKSMAAFPQFTSRPFTTSVAIVFAAFAAPLIIAAPTSAPAPPVAIAKSAANPAAAPVAAPIAAPAQTLSPFIA